MRKLLAIFILFFSAVTAQPRNILIISYAEYDASFNLTTKGLERASALAYYFSQTLLPTYGKPYAIFGSRQTKETLGGRRIMQTATPTSAILAKQLHLGFSEDDPEALASFILNNSDYQGQTLLIVWDFDAIPSLIDTFNYLKPTIPTPERFDVTYVLTFPFTPPKAPIILGQCLLVGDSCTSPPFPPPVPLNAYVPFQLINSSATFSDSEVFILVKGVEPQSNTWCYLSFDPALTPLPGYGVYQEVSPTTTSEAFSYTLSELPGSNNNREVFIPPFNQGELYFSIKGSQGSPELYKMDLVVETNPTTGALEPVDPDALNPKNSNYYTLFDKIDFTVSTTSAKLKANPTALDFFCLPLSLNMTLDSSSLPQTGLSDARALIFATATTTLTADDLPPGSKWNNLVIDDPTNIGNPLRIAATGPAMLTTPPLFDPNYLDNTAAYGFSYLTYIWNDPTAWYVTGGGQTLFIDTGSLTYSGQTVAASPSYNFVFTNGSDTEILTMPTNSVPFFLPEMPPLNASNATARGILARDLTAAFVTGLLPINGQLMNDPLNEAYFLANQMNFYPIPNNANLSPAGTASGPWFDLYSKALHSINGGYPNFDKIDTFLFDDLLGISGKLDSGASVSPSLAITLHDLSGTLVPNPYTDPDTFTVTITVPSNQFVTLEGDSHVYNNETVTLGSPVSTLAVTSIVGDDGLSHATTVYIKYGFAKNGYPGSLGISVTTSLTTASVVFPAPNS
ncbi:MAG: hypothetical protein JSR76_05025 [Verrucomicrobia bacterium]|nr:hypothetical protein [Verrucomicrobiota bacterium]